jgi:hypothetical protein
LFSRPIPSRAMEELLSAGSMSMPLLANRDALAAAVT